MLFKRIWLLSRLCCCITVFTLHMYASSMGTSACPNNVNASAFHFIHTALDKRFHLPDHPQHPGRDHILTFSIEPRFFSTSILQDHHVLLCLSGPYVAAHWPPYSVKLFVFQALSERRSYGLKISMDRLLRKCKIRHF